MNTIEICNSKSERGGCSHASGFESQHAGADGEEQVEGEDPKAKQGVEHGDTMAGGTGPLLLRVRNSADGVDIEFQVRADDTVGGFMQRIEGTTGRGDHLNILT